MSKVYFIDKPKEKKPLNFVCGCGRSENNPANVKDSSQGKVCIFCFMELIARRELSWKNN